MGCGASADEKFKLKFKLEGKKDGEDIAEGSEYLFRAANRQCPYSVEPALCDGQLCRVMKIQKNTSYPFETVFTTGDVGGKEQSCMAVDLHPIPAAYTRVPVPEGVLIPVWPPPPEAVAAAPKSAAAAAAPEAAAPAPKAAAPAPKAAPATTPEPDVTQPQRAPEAKKDNPAPTAARASPAEKEAEPVLVPGSFISDKVSCTYMNNEGKTYKWEAGDSVVAACDSQRFLVVKENERKNLTFRLSAEDKMITFDFVFNGKRMADSPQGHHCAQQVTQSIVEKFGIWLKSAGLPFEEGSIEGFQKEAAEKALKKAQESLAGVGEDFKKEVLDAHNKVRCGDGSFSRSGTSELTWSDECYIQAKLQAEACSRKDELELGHLNGSSGPHGQNLWKRGSGEPYLNPDFVTGVWTLGEEKYDFGKPGPQDKTRSFAQVVWKGTTCVGMAISDCGKFMVANYFPAGPLFHKESSDYEENVVAKTFEVPEHEEFDPGEDQAGVLAMAKNLDAAGNVKMH